MRIGQIIRFYKDLGKQIIRVYEDDNLILNIPAWEIVQKMSCDEWERWQNLYVREFYGNGVSINFYV